MAWKIRSISGSRRLNENMALEATRIIQFMVDNPANPEAPLGPFTIELPASYTEQQMRDTLTAEAQKLGGLAQGG